MSICHERLKIIDLKMFSLLALFSFLIVVKARVNPDGPTVVLDFSNCINKLIEINFKDPGVLIFANADNYSTSVSKIHSELLKRINDMSNYAVEVMNPEDEDINICDNYDDRLGVLHIDNFDVRPMPAYFVIIIDTYHEFPFLIGRLLRSRSWNPSAKFIILLFNFAKDEINMQFVEKMLTCLFRYNATEIIIVVPHGNNIRKAIVYGWRPYDPPKYCGYFNETAKNRLYVQNTCEKGSLRDHKLFSLGIPTDMKGCILDIIALERQPFVSGDERDSNVEMVLIDELVKTFNIKTKYNIVNSFRRGERENGQWDGALQLLTLKKGRVLLGGIFPDFDVHEDFGYSSSYLADSYTWVVPRAYHSPPWVALSIIFKREVWYSVIAAFIISVLSWRMLGQLDRDSTYNRSLGHNFMNSWICFLGFSCYIRPTRQSLRIFFSFFNIYCILVITAYQTKLIDVLKNPRFDYQMQNVEELVTSDLKFGGYEVLRDLFLNSSDLFDNIIFEQWTIVNNITKAMLDVTVHRNFSILCSRLELSHLTAVTPDLSDNFGAYKYYAYDMNMFSVPVEMLALRGFAFMKMFSDTIGVFKQMGIPEFLRRRFAWFNGKRRAKLLRAILMEKSDVNSLSLEHLQAGFLVLVLGYMCGSIVFVLEIIANTKWVKIKYAQLVSQKKKILEFIKIE